MKLTIKKEWGENRRQFLLLILFITGAMSIESFLQISSAYNQVEYLYMTTGGENVVSTQRHSNIFSMNATTTCNMYSLQ